MSVFRASLVCDETIRLRLLGLLGLADTSGLTGDGLQPMVPLPAGVQIEDGGAAVFTTRRGDEGTAHAVDQLGMG